MLKAYILHQMNLNKGAFTKNKNENLQWAISHRIVIDHQILEDLELRGIYGFFVDGRCEYIGRSYSIYARLFRGNCHIRNLKYHEQINGDYLNIIYQGIESGALVEIKVLEAIPYDPNMHPAKNAQQLASRECAYIDQYQAADQCLHQYPEGRW